MNYIFKSCKAGVTDREFEQNHSGLTSYMSFARMMDNSIRNGVGLKSNERIVGMKIDSDGIKFYLETETAL